MNGAACVNQYTDVLQPFYMRVYTYVLMFAGENRHRVSLLQSRSRAVWDTHLDKAPLKGYQGTKRQQG